MCAQVGQLCIASYFTSLPFFLIFFNLNFFFHSFALSKKQHMTLNRRGVYVTAQSARSRCWILRGYNWLGLTVAAACSGSYPGLTVLAITLRGRGGTEGSSMLHVTTSLLKLVFL
jgi:hypothetical protein